MNEQQSNELRRAIASGLEDQDWNALAEWLSDESSFAFRQGNAAAFDAVNDMDFKALYELIHDAAFLSEQDFPHKVFLFFESEWQRLSEPQKLALRGALEIVYGELKDPAAWFVIAELLGEYYSDAGTLLTLQRLSLIQNEDARSLTAYGFKKLIKNASPQRAEQARETLRRMLSDTSSKVRDEIHAALSR